MGDIKVEKRDGLQEAFDLSKLRNSIVSAGANEGQAEGIVSKIETWAQESAVNGVIKSNDIRTEVLKLLMPVAPEAAKAYESYKKPAES